MPKPVSRERLQELMERGAQVIDVLPEDEYAYLHLPGAISIPLKTLTAATVARLDKNAPTVTYCFDFL